MNTITKPFLPSERTSERTARTQSIKRAIIAHARCTQGFPGEVASYAETRWPGDALAVDIATRGAVTPMSTGTSGFGQPALADLVGILGPASAAAQLFGKSLQLQFLNRASQIQVPDYTASPTGVSFVAEGSPWPVVQLDLSAMTILTPRKMALGFAITRELAESGNGEQYISRALSENLVLAADTLLFDDVAATAVRPAGLRAGIAALVATAGGGSAALIGDLAQLAQAVGGVSPNIVYVTSLVNWIKIAAYLPNFPIPVLPTGAVADDELLVVAADALAVAGSPDAIRIERSIEALVHMESATPLAISTAGSPNTIAAPVRSAFQTDAVVIRLLLDLSWALRSTNAVAWISGVTW